MFAAKTEATVPTYNVAYVCVFEYEWVMSERCERTVSAEQGEHNVKWQTAADR